jgi:hypothetical protein
MHVSRESNIRDGQLGFELTICPPFKECLSSTILPPEADTTDLVKLGQQSKVISSIHYNHHYERSAILHQATVYTSRILEDIDALIHTYLITVNKI